MNGYKGDMDELVERSCKAALWDETKDKLKESGYALSEVNSSGSASREPIEPEVILMDEPCSALDPISTLKIEEMMHELKKNYTIVIVTHNMQQAVRVSDYTGFFNVSQRSDRESKVGTLVEFAETERIFNAPKEQATQDYVTGRFG